MLEAIKLGQYAEAFEAQGYDDMPFLRSMGSGEGGGALLDALASQTGMKAGHVRKLASYLSGEWVPV